MRISSKNPALIAILVLLLQTCAGLQHGNSSVDVFEERNGHLPLVLRFPSGTKVVDEIAVRKLELKQNITIGDHWDIARYYHTSAVHVDRLDRAMSHYRSIVTAAGADRSMALNNTACILLETGRYREGEKLFHEMLSGKTAIITVYYNLSVLYRHSGRIDDAVSVLYMMKVRYPENVYALVELGDIYTERNLYDPAEELYREALIKDRRNAVPVHRMALLKEKKGDLKEAERFYINCINRFPYYEKAYLDYSSMLLRSNRKEQARKVLNSGIRHLKIKDISPDRNRG